MKDLKGCSFGAIGTAIFFIATNVSVHMVRLQQQHYIPYKPVIVRKAILQMLTSEVKQGRLAS